MALFTSRKIVNFALALWINFLLFSCIHGKSELCKKKSSDNPSVTTYLYCDYDYLQPPVGNNTNTTEIYVDLVPQSINFDDKSGYLDIEGFLYYEWMDSRLSWNPDLFRNVSEIHLAMYSLWTPTTRLHNVGKSDQSWRRAECFVNVEGSVWCSPSVRYRIKCQTDFTLWPYDRQNCSLVLRSWIENNSGIVYSNHSPPVYTYNFRENQMWRMQITRALRETKSVLEYYNSTAMIITIDLILDRVHNHMRAVYVTPAIIMIIMTMTVLWLDARSTERLIVAAFNPIFHLICIQNLHAVIPHNGDTVPHILFFYMGSFIMSTIALLLTISLAEIHNMKKSPPNWISALTAITLRSKFGQIFLLGMLDPKAYAEMEFEADDNSDLFDCSRTKKSAWAYVTIVLSWILFVVSLITYVIMFAHLMPNSSMKPPLNTTEIIV